MLAKVIIPPHLISFIKTTKVTIEIHNNKEQSWGMGLVPVIKYLIRFYWKHAFAGIYCSDIKFTRIKLGSLQLFIS